MNSMSHNQFIMNHFTFLLSYQMWWIKLVWYQDKAIKNIKNQSNQTSPLHKSSSQIGSHGMENYFLLICSVDEYYDDLELLDSCQKEIAKYVYTTYTHN